MTNPKRILILALLLTATVLGAPLFLAEPAAASYHVACYTVASRTIGDGLGDSVTIDSISNCV